MKRWMLATFVMSLALQSGCNRCPDGLPKVCRDDNEWCSCTASCKNNVDCLFDYVCHDGSVCGPAHGDTTLTCGGDGQYCCLVDDKELECDPGFLCHNIPASTNMDTGYITFARGCSTCFETGEPCVTGTTCCDGLTCRPVAAGDPAKQCLPP